MTIGSQNGREITAPEVIARGFAESGPLLDEARDEAARTLAHCLSEDISELKLLQEHIHDAVGTLIRERTGRRPMILPVVLEVYPQRKPVSDGAGCSGLEGGPGWDLRCRRLERRRSARRGWKTEARYWIWPRPGPSSMPATVDPDAFLEAVLVGLEKRTDASEARRLEVQHAWRRRKPWMSATEWMGASR